MNIKSLYHNYLQYKETERAHGKDKFFHASSAGSCYKKVLYRHFDYPQTPMDDRSYRLLRLGTIVHEEIQGALKDVLLDDTCKISGDRMVNIHKYRSSFYNTMIWVIKQVWQLQYMPISVGNFVRGIEYRIYVGGNVTSCTCKF